MFFDEEVNWNFVLKLESNILDIIIIIRTQDLKLIVAERLLLNITERY